MISGSKSNSPVLTGRRFLVLNHLVNACTCEMNQTSAPAHWIGESAGHYVHMELKSFKPESRCHPTDIFLPPRRFSLFKSFFVDEGSILLMRVREKLAGRITGWSMWRCKREFVLSISSVFILPIAKSAFEMSVEYPRFPRVCLSPLSSTSLQGWLKSLKPRYL